MQYSFLFSTLYIFNDPLLMGDDATSPAPRGPVISPPAGFTACPMATNSSKCDTSPTPSTTKRSAKRIRDDTDDVIREALHQLRELSSTQDTAQDCNAFANVVGNDLRQLTGETKILAEKLIYDVIFLAKLDRLSSSSVVKE